MPKLQTTGTECCGMLSVSSFYSGGRKDRERCKKDVDHLVSEYLLEYDQPYGCTEEYDLDTLMGVVDERLQGRMLQAVLSISQYTHWHSKLKKHGFKLVRKFSNPTGGTCFYYIRLPKKSWRPIKKGER